MSGKLSIAGQEPVTLQTTLGELIRRAVEQEHPKLVTVFDFPSGRQIALTVFTSDVGGYLNTVQCYEDSRDAFAQAVAKHITESIRKHGLPEEGQEFNLVHNPR